MADIASVNRQMKAVVAVIDAAGAARVPVERHNHVLLAMAAVSRCRSLLLGAFDLHGAGRSDIVGVPVRALLEVWYLGVIALLGDEGDLRRLEQDHRYWKNDLAKHFPGVEPDKGKQVKFSVYQRATRADELLEQLGQERTAVEYYRIF